MFRGTFARAGLPGKTFWGAVACRTRGEQPHVTRAAVQTVAGGVCSGDLQRERVDAGDAQEHGAGRAAVGGEVRTREDSCCLPSEGSAGAVWATAGREQCVCERVLRASAGKGRQCGQTCGSQGGRSGRDVPLQVQVQVQVVTVGSAWMAVPAAHGLPC